MFTGIVESMGRVAASRRLAGGGARLTFEAPFAKELVIGESVAVDGVCLTVASPPRGRRFEADLSPETLARTTLGRLTIGRNVNLERALLVGSRFGGHIVQGHVDGVTTIVAVKPQSGFREVRFAIPRGGARFLVEKGSVALDGISLTVASLSRRDFGVAVIPKTLEATTLASRRVGDEINVEYDVVSKYVERLVGKR